MILRSTGVEYPVAGDPVKLHGLIRDGEQVWRCECMACGHRGTLVDTPGRARAACVDHARGIDHRARVAKR